MPAPTAKVNSIQQVCKVLRDIKASQTRGKVGSSLEGKGASASIPPLPDPDKSQNRPLFLVLTEQLVTGWGWTRGTAWFNYLLSSCDNCVRRLSYRTRAWQQGQAGAKGSCSSQTPLSRALKLMIKEGIVSSVPPKLWLQGFILHLPTYIYILASNRRTKDWLLTSVLHFASCLSSEIPSQVMWPVHSSLQEISKGTLKSILKHLIWNSCDYILVSGAKLLWKQEKPYTW